MSAIYRLEHSTETLTNVHDEQTCAGRPCPLHNLTEHSMRNFPQHFRSDRGLMERICPHGVGHPDPDDVHSLAQPGGGVHGCDGCCSDACVVCGAGPNGRCSPPDGYLGECPHDCSPER